ncbi:MAG: FAD-dependent oxidoreductase [Cyclobacteriaceae bacterium]
MNKNDVELVLSPEEAFNEQVFQMAARKAAGLPATSDLIFQPARRSIDARGKRVVVRFTGTWSERSSKPITDRKAAYQFVGNSTPVAIVGAGPAGLFAALRLIELGMRPIVLERGKDVQARRRDIAAINKDQIVNPESNYCFGEGGAGTYSDGKLYTRSKKRGDVGRILEILQSHGATEEILYDAHPHIGTNKLPKLVSELTKSIVDAGGTVLYNTRMAELIIQDGTVHGVLTASGEKIPAAAVILATGHSARDVFEYLHGRNILIEAKPFALGLRVEHPQQLIDQIQYHCSTDRGAWLPASSYALVHQAQVNGADRGVFSFCMCPGGFIVPAATAPGEVVVNGMSPSRRDSRYANSGIVVAVDVNDYANYADKGPLAGMYFQSDIERKACAMAGNSQVAPAQLLVDFTERRLSKALLETSYQPGLAAVNLHEVLPPFIGHALIQGFLAFGKKMKGYLTDDAQVVGVESRSSSPVRIPRHNDSLEHVTLKRFFPCGEGAGYAGGIVSAAMDGERCAEAVVKLYAK